MKAEHNPIHLLVDTIWRNPNPTLQLLSQTRIDELTHSEGKLSPLTEQETSLGYATSECFHLLAAQ